MKGMKAILVTFLLAFAIGGAAAIRALDATLYVSHGAETRQAQGFDALGGFGYLPKGPLPPSGTNHAPPSTPSVGHKQIKFVNLHMGSSRPSHPPHSTLSVSHEEARFGYLPKGPVPPSGPSHPPPSTVSAGLEETRFGYLPKGPVPPSGPSHPPAQSVDHEKISFGYLPKGPVPPSGPSHPPPF
ncbi:PREDICTED: proline-rich protein 2 [Nelumbo nucifera]|uniref:Proline-rich protein 2 n=2 Tax=Nelumbo nucifera TaxID=4432 RepID=A0A1U8AZ25_NELNU|nr:PREDICTED: proline-rich protein 2 [Nelumbo nucifera]